MKFQIKYGELAKQKSNCLIVGAFEDEMTTAELQQVDRILAGGFAMATRSGEFKGSKGETLLIHNPHPFGCSRVLFVGLGKKDKFTLGLLRQTGSEAATFLSARRIISCQLATATFRFGETVLKENLQALIEGFLLAGYSYDSYLPEARKKTSVLEWMELLLVDGDCKGEAQAAIYAALAICSGVCLARDLVNTPGNVKSPEFLARQALTLGELENVSVRLIEVEELKKQGFNALLAVAQGSERDPYLIIVEYQGGDAGDKPHALVGKGVVFDSGGISLKPGAAMDEMKMDMAGAAAVLGTIDAAARMKLPVNLVGVVPTVENMPSGTSYRPGDIVTSLAGKTIEVLNTDAEGRLILADAMTYVARYQPQSMIDLATLTGACIVALGEYGAGAMSNNDELAQTLVRCGQKTNEKVWQLPLWDEYTEQIKSDFADLKNTGGRPGGALTAAAFLKEFAGEIPWVHLDIAGVAWASAAKPGRPKGGTGYGVRLLIDYLQSLAK